MRKVFMGSLAGLLMVAAPGLASAACNIGDKGSEAELAKVEGIRSGEFGDVRRDMRQLRSAAMVLQRYGKDEACQELVTAMTEMLRDPRSASQLRADWMNRTTATTNQDDGNVTTQSTTNPDTTTTTQTQDTTATQDTSGTATTTAPTTTATTDQTATNNTVGTGTGMMTWEERRRAAVPFNERQGAMSANDLIGSDIYGADNESIGEIDDIVVTQGNKPAYALVSYGGFLGMGEEQAAIPVTQLRVSPDNYVFMNMTSEQLQAAPTLKRGTSDWWSNQAWVSENENYYSNLR